MDENALAYIQGRRNSSILYDFIKESQEVLFELET